MLHEFKNYDIDKKKICIILKGTSEKIERSYTTDKKDCQLINLTQSKRVQ